MPACKSRRFWRFRPCMVMPQSTTGSKAVFQPSSSTGRLPAKSGRVLVRSAKASKATTVELALNEWSICRHSFFERKSLCMTYLYANYVYYKKLYFVFKSYFSFMHTSLCNKNQMIFIS